MYVPLAQEDYRWTILMFLGRQYYTISTVGESTDEDGEAEGHKKSTEKT
jgi:hypothetical protein